MNTQKERIQQLQSLLQQAKASYSTALKNLEKISESIHKMRGDLGVREPGVGAEASEIPPESENNLEFNLDDVKYARSESRSTSRSRSEVGTERDFGEEEEEIMEMRDVVKMKEDDVETLRMKVRSLAVRPIEGCGDGQQDETHQNWESELNATVDKLDNLMLLREKTQGSIKSEPQSPYFEQKPLKQLQKQNPLPLSIVSLQSLPTSQNALPFNSRFLNESTTINCDNLMNKKRKLSLG